MNAGAMVNGLDVNQSGNSVAERGALRVRVSKCPSDIAKARLFRSQCFGIRHDADQFDVHARHVFVEARATNEILAYFRLHLYDPTEVCRSYSNQYYDLTCLNGYHGRLMEIGRFCIIPSTLTLDVLRLAWGAIATIVDQAHVRLLFGCTSFKGTCVKTIGPGLALLNARYLAPTEWRPAVRRGETLLFSDVEVASNGTNPNGWECLPPLLRSYLAMGGWVSDHLVIDRNLNTLHVFTGLEIASVSPARQRRLQSILGPDAWRQVGISMAEAKAVDAPVAIA